MNKNILKSDSISLTLKEVHNIRNSLNTILGYSQLLQDEESMSDENNKMLESIEKAAIKIKSMFGQTKEQKFLLESNYKQNTRSKPTDTNSQKILIVDDQKENLALFKDILTPYGYEINVAQNGLEALNIVATFHPELILLDIVMPEMNGFEVLKELQKDKLTSEIPVIFLTANATTDDIVLGFNAGVVDYIAKPFHQRELIARVNTHLKQAKLFLNIKRLMEHSFHELYTPLTVINSAMQMQELEYEKTNYTQMSLASSKTLQNIYDELYYSMNYSKTFKSKTVFDLSILLADRISYFTLIAESRSLIFNTQLTEPMLIEFNQEDMERVVDNLISNAIKYTQEHKQITISQDCSDGKCKFYICNPVSKKIDVEKIFQKYYRNEEEIFGFGLGLELVQSMCKQNNVKIRAICDDKSFCIEMELS